MVVNTTNVYSKVRDEIVSLINSNLKDPKTGLTNSRRRWIHREFPDTTSRTFEGYPLLVIKSPELDDENQSLNGCLTSGIMNLSIEIYVEFNDTNARVDDLSNNIYALFRSITNRKALLKKNISFEKLDGGAFESSNEDGKQLSFRRMLLFVNSTLQE